MDSKRRFQEILQPVIWVAFMSLVHVGAVSAAETHFDYTVPADAAPSDYQTVVSFSSPTGVGANRKTIARIVTPTPTAGISFEIAPPAGKKVAQVLVDGATDYVEVGGTGESVATLVVAQAISDAPDNAPVAAGFAMIRVTIEYDSAYDFGAGGETWNLKALEQTSARRYMGFVATDTDNPATPAVNEVDALVTKPKISVPATGLNFGDVQQGISTAVAPVLPIAVNNVGTASLNVTGAPISGDTVPSTFELNVSIVSPINPGGQLDNVFDEDASDGVTEKKGLWIMAHPPTLGAKTATATVQSSGGDAPVSLSVNGITLFGELLMDVSGSMSYAPDGSRGVPEPQSRLAQAKQGGKEINNWIREFSSGQSYLGLTSFPAPSNLGNGDSAVVVPVDRSINTHPSIQVAFGPVGVGGMQPRNATPMEAGIIAAVGDMDGRINGPQPPSAGDRPNLRQAILLLSDGDETTGDAASQIASLSSNGIRAYTIGYGLPGSATVNEALLQNIASGTGGAFFSANSLDAFGLKNALKSAVTPWLGLRTVVDPKGTIRQGQTASHAVCLDKTAYGVTFSVDWSRHVPNGLSLVLVSPRGETITPSSPDVAHYASDTFAMYVIRGKRLRGGQGAGKWTLRVTGGSGIPAAEDTEYSYNVLVQSPMGIAPRPRVSKLVTGAEYLLEVALSKTYPQAAISQGLSMTANFDYPAESFGTWISLGKVEPEWILGESEVGRAKSSTAASHEMGAAKVPGTIMGERASLVQKKAYALNRLVQKPFLNKRTTGSVQLYDDGTHGDKTAGDGTYSAHAPQLRYDGVYNLAIVAEAFDGLGDCLRREVSIAQYVAISFTRESIGKHLAWASVSVTPYFGAELKKILSEQPQAGYERRSVVFTPQDSFGNYWGPGHAAEIRFAFKGGSPLGPIVDNLDGSYVQVVEYKKGEPPTVEVSAAGVTGELESRLPEAADWWKSWYIYLILILIALVVALRKKLFP